jgi:hypothetical protein
MSDVMCAHARPKRLCPTCGPASARVDHPQHYGGAENPFEVIKVLEVWLTPDEFRGFLKGNVIKYLARARMKGGTEDQAKAAWYAQRLVDYETKHMKQEQP